MGRASERWGPSAPRGCTTSGRAPWSTARRKQCRGSSANRTERSTMADKSHTEPVDGAPDETSPVDMSASDAVFELQRERDDLHDRLLRKTAEFDNYRKRVERERREQADQAVTDLLEDLLLVVDDFDRALTVNAPGDDADGGSAYRKGVELIHAKRTDLLRKRGVRPIETLGADFDPN